MHLSSQVELLESKALKLNPIAKLAFILTSIINIEIAKTKTSFLNIAIIVGIMAQIEIIIAFDLIKIMLYLV